MMKVSPAKSGLSRRLVVDKILVFNITGRRIRETAREAAKAIIAIRNMKETYALNEIWMPAFFSCV